MDEWKPMPRTGLDDRGGGGRAMAVCFAGGRGLGCPRVAGGRAARSHAGADPQPRRG